MKTKVRLAILITILAVTVGCDQTSKHLARTHLGPRDSIELPGGIGELTLAENPGSFLSLGAALPPSWRMALLTVGVGVGLLCLFIYLARNSRLQWIAFVSLALIWAGGTSNFIDRVTREGHVTDFVILRAGPVHTGVFNGADVLIVAGFLGLACSLRKSPVTPPTSGAER
jgi:signal peptidase II